MWRVYFLIVLAIQSTHSQTITQNFGAGANQFSIDFVEIGNPGNVAGYFSGENYGAVSYIYRIGKYEISRDMIEKANVSAALGITMWDMSSKGGNGSNKPATGVSWYEAAKFVNYLNISSGAPAAYKFDNLGNFQLWTIEDVGYNPNNLFRNSLARYFLPSTDEWCKAAYGSPNGTWYFYPTGSNEAPTAVSGGTATNTAVYNRQSGPADITNAGGLSAWGTMAQGGNVLEFTETEYDRSNDSVIQSRWLGGGAWYLTGVFADMLGSTAPEKKSSTTGFRIASVSPTYVLTTVVDSSLGTVSKTPAKDYYLQDDIVTLTATPKAGYLFSSWSEVSTATTSSITLTMNADKTVTANFIQDGGDNDGDGLTNYQESITYGTNPNQKDSNGDGVEDGHAVSMGYNPTQNFSALVAHPPTGLYTASQMQTLAFGDLVLTKNPNGSFTLNYDIEQSTDLQNWSTYAPLSMPLTGLPEDKAFVRIKAKQ